MLLNPIEYPLQLHPGSFLADGEGTPLRVVGCLLSATEARANGLDRVAFGCSDWFAQVLGRQFQLITSNPPYVDAGDPHLLKGDVSHEPRSALVAGADGLQAIRTLAAGCGKILKAGGKLLLEHGADPAARDKDQRTAAEIAWGRGNRDIYDLLQAAKQPQIEQR